MDLPQRMAWRREMVYRSVRETLTNLEVLGSQYKFRAMRIDDRGHCFLIMIDTARTFQVGPATTVRGWREIESLIKHNAYTRYGVIIHGMYWRTHDDVNAFARQARRDDPPAVAEAIRAGRWQTPRPPAGVQAPLSRESGIRFEPVSDDEAAAFREALAQGMRPPPLRVGQQEYQSDLAPLSDDGIMIGGTQYGELR